MFPQVDSAKAQLKGGGKGGRVEEDCNETSAALSTGSNSTESSGKDGKNKAGNIKSILGQLFFRFEIQLLPVLIVMMITMPLTVRELMKMRKASTHQSQDRGLVLAVIYSSSLQSSRSCVLFHFASLKQYIPRHFR